MTPLKIAIVGAAALAGVALAALLFSPAPAEELPTAAPPPPAAKAREKEPRRDKPAPPAVLERTRTVSPAPQAPADPREAEELKRLLAENASRTAFNNAAIRAKQLAAKRDYAGASALFEEVRKSAGPEVAQSCTSALVQLKAAAADHEAYEQERRTEAAWKAVRTELVPKLAAFVRARAYPEALAELEGAAKNEAWGPLADVFADERAAVAEAAAYWEAFQKSLQSRLGQMVSIQQLDKKRHGGKLAHLHDDRLQLDTPEGLMDIPFSTLHADILVGWTLGKTLPANEGASYVKAALFFFCEGREDLARRYLATAHELKGRADGAERIFREGLLRQAAPVKK